MAPILLCITFKTNWKVIYEFCWVSFCLCYSTIYSVCVYISECNWTLNPYPLNPALFWCQKKYNLTFQWLYWLLWMACWSRELAQTVCTNRLNNKRASQILVLSCKGPDLHRLPHRPSQNMSRWRNLRPTNAKSIICALAALTWWMRYVIWCLRRCCPVGCSPFFCRNENVDVMFS